MNNKFLGWVQIIIGAIIFLWNLLSSLRNEILSSNLISMLGDEWGGVMFFQSISHYVSFVKWAIFGIALVIILQGIINIKKKAN